MDPSQLAINSVSVKADSLEVMLDAFASAGFAQVEFQLPVLKTWLAEGHRLADLQALLDRYQLGFIGGFEAQVLCFADEPKQQANRELQRANAKLVDALGGGTIVVGSDGPAQPRDDDLLVVGRALGELAEELPESVSMALEFNWSPVVRSVKSAYEVVVAADHPRVGILFDPAHYHCTPSKFEDLTRDVCRRIQHVHVDDMRDKPGDRSQCNADRVLPGEGCLDLPRILNTIEDAGYSGWFSLEMFNADLWALPPHEAAKLMYQAMERLTD